MRAAHTSHASCTPQLMHGARSLRLWAGIACACASVLALGCTPQHVGDHAAPTRADIATSDTSPTTTRLEHLDATVRVSGGLGDAPVRIEGDARWRLTLGADRAITLHHDAFDVQTIEATSAHTGAPIQATPKRTSDALTLTFDAPPNTPITARIRYTTTPRRGITTEKTPPKDGSAPALWTSFRTWAWLPVSRDPSQRATLRLNVETPDRPNAVTLATGDGPDRPGPDIASRVPHPSYLWGFAVGAFRRAPTPASTRDGWALHPWTYDPQHPGAAIAQARTRAALERWRRAGAPWPHDGTTPAPYTQVFVPGRAAQELAGMAFMSASTLDGLTQNPDEDWLLVHELAHEVWGNRVTCAAWGDFWLNEAVVVWWVAHDKALRGDTAGAQRERHLWTKRVQRALTRGDDARVVRPGASVERAGGSIVYHAGALVLDDIATHEGADRLLAALHSFMRDALAHGSVALTTDALLARLALNPARERHIRASLANAQTILSASDAGTSP